MTFKGCGVQSTERDFADKSWLQEPMPFPILLMNVGSAILCAVGIVILIVLVLSLT
jgi:hypothetical protein